MSVPRVPVLLISIHLRELSKYFIQVNYRKTTTKDFFNQNPYQKTSKMKFSIAASSLLLLGLVTGSPLAPIPRDPQAGAPNPGGWQGPHSRSLMARDPEPQAGAPNPGGWQGPHSPNLMARDPEPQAGAPNQGGWQAPGGPGRRA